MSTIAGPLHPGTETTSIQLLLHACDRRLSHMLCDPQVLSVLPGTIRRRVLRHLYLAPMQQCYLFADCKQKFLDALLAAARMELFMPQVLIKSWPLANHSASLRTSHSILLCHVCPAHKKDACTPSILIRRMHVKMLEGIGRSPPPQDTQMNVYGLQ